MSQIDDEVLSKLEKLSRLSLTTEERETIKSDLNKVVGMFDKLTEIDTDGVEPLRHISTDVNVLRPDVVSGELSQEAALHNVAKSSNGYIAVPKFLKPK